MSDVAYHAVIAVVELVIKVIAVVEPLQQSLLNQHSNYCMASHMIARDPREDPYDPHITHTHTYTYTDTDTDTSIHPSIHPSSIHMYIITRDLREDPYESILMVAPQQGRQLVILSLRAQHLTHTYAHAPMQAHRHATRACTARSPCRQAGTQAGTHASYGPRRHRTRIPLLLLCYLARGSTSAPNPQPSTPNPELPPPPHLHTLASARQHQRHARAAELLAVGIAAVEPRRFAPAAHPQRRIRACRCRPHARLPVARTRAPCLLHASLSMCVYSCRHHTHKSIYLSMYVSIRIHQDTRGKHTRRPSCWHHGKSTCRWRCTARVRQRRQGR